MLSMAGSKQGSWETVGKPKKAPSDKKRDGQQQAGKGGKGGKGGDAGANPVFAEFDRAYANMAAREQEAAAAAAAAAAAGEGPRYAGAFAGLKVEEPPSDAPRAPLAAAAAAAPKAKPPKQKAPKKPRVTVAAAAAAVDAAELSAALGALRERYAASEASQLEVAADRLARALAEAQVDLPRVVAAAPRAGSAAGPLDELPAPVAGAVSGFFAGAGDAAVAEVVVTLLSALAEGLAPAGLAQQQPPSEALRRQQAGLLVALAAMLRARPAALVAAAPQLLALGRELTSPGRLPLLLWALAQAAARDPGAAVGAWTRVVLPQCLGAPLPAPGSKAAQAAAAGQPQQQTQQLPRLDAASQEAAVAFVARLLPAALAASGGADVALPGGRSEPAVPPAAIEALARAAVPAAAPAGGKGSGGGASAEALAQRLHGPLVALAGASCALTKQQQADWLLLALETAATAPAEGDASAARAAASAAAALASPAGAAAFAAWEERHKGHVRGSSRVLRALARRPELLKPVLARRDRADAWRALLSALPARHRGLLAAGRGWQAAAAREADGAIAQLLRRAGGGGSIGGGGAGAVLAGALAAAAAVGGALAVAAAYRLETAAVVARYAGRPAAEALDAQLLAPLNAATAPVRAALAPLAAEAAAALATAAAAAREALAPWAARAEEALARAVAAARGAYAAAHAKAAQQ